MTFFNPPDDYYQDLYADVGYYVEENDVHNISLLSLDIGFSDHEKDETVAQRENTDDWYETIVNEE